jgi:hypothetical protein
MPKPIGLLHPGEMGATVGGALRNAGQEVVWASEGRGEATVRRAEENNLTDLGTVAEVTNACDVVLSICPPHAATEVAELVAGFEGTFVECNAIAPDTALAIAATVEAAGTRYVDGSIIGPPPVKPGVNRLYLAGPGSEEVAALFEGSLTDARIVSGEIPDASALKMSYAAWTKGTWALVLAIRGLARSLGVEAHLLEEWKLSMPDLEDYSLKAGRAAATKGWRWIGEMEEIASTFAAAGLTDGFHVGAGDVYRGIPRITDPPEDDAELLEATLGLLMQAAAARGV